MHLEDGVEVHESLERLAAEVRDLSLAQGPVGRAEDVADAPPAAVLHDDPEVLGAREAAEVSHHVRVDALPQHRNLTPDVLQALLVLSGERDDLDGDDRAAGSMPRLVHGAVAPLAELLEQLEQVLGAASRLHGCPSTPAPARQFNVSFSSLGPSDSCNKLAAQ